MTGKRPGEDTPKKIRKVAPEGFQKTLKARSKSGISSSGMKKIFGKTPKSKVAVGLEALASPRVSAKGARAHPAASTPVREVEANGSAMVEVMMPQIERDFPEGTWVAFNVDRGGYVTAETQLELVEKFEAQFGRDRGWFDEVGRRQKKTAERHR